MGVNNPEKTRRALLDATLELLEDPATAEVGMAEIGARAGYSRQAVYRHFGSRGGLLKEALADIDERAGAERAVARVLSAEDGVAVLDAFIFWWAGYVRGFAGVARSVYAGRVNDPALATAWEDRMEALLGVCQAVVKRCAEEDLLRPELTLPVAAEMLWAMLSIPLWDQLTGDRGWSRAQYSKRVGQMARATLLAAPATTTRRSGRR